ncbi:MAG: hypothetical protein PHW96_04065, partial [Candidatus Nanoarchaeia archaeon]|nr:hypothetical protein [Candidatus Nanoarchaeia archaeon]
GSLRIVVEDVLPSKIWQNDEAIELTNKVNDIHLIVADINDNTQKLPDIIKNELKKQTEQIELDIKKLETAVEKRIRKAENRIFDSVEQNGEKILNIISSVIKTKDSLLYKNMEEVVETVVKKYQSGQGIPEETIKKLENAVKEIENISDKFDKEFFPQLTQLIEDMNALMKSNDFKTSLYLLRKIATELEVKDRLNIIFSELFELYTKNEKTRITTIDNQIEELLKEEKQ